MSRFGGGFDYTRMDLYIIRRDLERLKLRITTEGFTPQNVKLTGRILLRWLIQHIRTTDRALADHLQITP